MNESLNEKKHNNNIINKTITTSVNSSSLNSNNNISSFRMSKSSFRNSSLNYTSSPKNNSNIILNSFNLKNAIAKAELNNFNNNKNKRNQINIISVSNSQKKLLIAEYSVKKPLIQNSYLSFNKNSFNNNNTNHKNEIFMTLPNVNKLSFSLERNNNKNKKKFQEILDNIISSSEEISKNINKSMNNYNKKSRSFSKNFNYKELNLMKETLEDKLSRENYFHKLRYENVKYDNKLIEILKNTNQPFICEIIKHRNKIRNKTMEIKKKYLIKSIKYKINFGDFNIIVSRNKNINEFDKFKESLDDNFEKMKYLTKLIQIDKKKIIDSNNDNNNKIDIYEKIRKLKEFKRKKNKTVC